MHFHIPRLLFVAMPFLRFLNLLPVCLRITSVCNLREYVSIMGFWVSVASVIQFPLLLLVVHCVRVSYIMHCRNKTLLIPDLSCVLIHHMNCIFFLFSSLSLSHLCHIYSSPCVLICMLCLTPPADIQVFHMLTLKTVHFCFILCFYTVHFLYVAYHCSLFKVKMKQPILHPYCDIFPNEKSKYNVIIYTTGFQSNIYLAQNIKTLKSVSNEQLACY